MPASVWFLAASLLALTAVLAKGAVRLSTAVESLDQALDDVSADVVEIQLADEAAALAETVARLDHR